METIQLITPEEIVQAGLTYEPDVSKCDSRLTKVTYGGYQRHGDDITVDRPWETDSKAARWAVIVAAYNTCNFTKLNSVYVIEDTTNEVFNLVRFSVRIYGK